MFEACEYLIYGRLGAGQFHDLLMDVVEVVKKRQVRFEQVAEYVHQQLFVAHLFAHGQKGDVVSLAQLHHRKGDAANEPVGFEDDAAYPDVVDLLEERFELGFVEALEREVTRDEQLSALGPGFDVDGFQNHGARHRAVELVGARDNFRRSERGKLHGIANVQDNSVR